MIGHRIVSVLFAILSVSFSEVYGNTLVRVKRQEQGSSGEIVDNIFNIPITAIRQTATAAQTLLPENTETIDSVFKIPITTLEAVGALVKSTAPQREEIQRRRAERRDQVQAQREQQRIQREQQRLQREKLQQEKFERRKQRVPRHYHHDPLGLNSLANLLVGHHGILSGHSGLDSFFTFGHQSHNNNHGNHGNHQEIIGSHGGHGGHGGHGSHGSLGSHGSGSGQNTYEVYEELNEDTKPTIWQGLGSFFGSQASASSNKIQNKIAPKVDRKKYSRYQDDEFPLENKIAPKYNSGFFPASSDDEYVANGRNGRSRLVLEHRSI